MSFFTAALMMLPLLALLAWLPGTGLYRAAYRLDPACDRCSDELERPAAQWGSNVRLHGPGHDMLGGPIMPD